MTVVGTGDLGVCWVKPWAMGVWWPCGNAKCFSVYSEEYWFISDNGDDGLDGYVFL